MCFISKEIREGVLINAKLPARYMFVEYACEGVCEENNEIFLALDSEKFLRTLRQINNYSRSLKFKLTQKGHNSFIEITIEQQVTIAIEDYCFLLKFIVFY